VNRATHDQSTTLEACAREALDARAGRRLTDEEWENAKNAFLALFRLLQDWNHEDTTAVALNAMPDMIPPNATPTNHPAETVLSLAVSEESGYVL
jgi:hypothetical protein